ncbi:MAG: hypothetical protein QF834_07180 [Candidatus Thalassarchaeaceae archaeon]|nr:hypothetical protein [Candidatus Thalassarchaeaceae archaeon]
MVVRREFRGHVHGRVHHEVGVSDRTGDVGLLAMAPPIRPAKPLHRLEVDSKRVQRVLPAARFAQQGLQHPLQGRSALVGEGVVSTTPVDLRSDLAQVALGEGPRDHVGENPLFEGADGDGGPESMEAAPLLHLVIP